MPGAAYREKWKAAFDQYVAGNWSEAEKLFAAFSQERPDIQTTSVVYAYMKKRNFTAPTDWKGFRALTSK